MLHIIKKIGFSLYLLSIQQVFLIVEAYELCYWRNQTIIYTIGCNDGCCNGISTAPQTACCNSTSWSTLAIPIFVITAICLLAVCLVYFRPLLKHCLCGCKCPCGHRTRVTSTNAMSGNTNPVYNINNDDLPDYETTIKGSRPKDSVPPPYNFVTAHPMDFGIEPCVPSAPPQYSSRCNSATIVGRLSSVEI